MRTSRVDHASCWRGGLGIEISVPERNPRSRNGNLGPGTRNRNLGPGKESSVSEWKSRSRNGNLGPGMEISVPENRAGLSDILGHHTIQSGSGRDAVEWRCARPVRRDFSLPTYFQNISKDDVEHTHCCCTQCVRVLHLWMWPCWNHAHWTRLENHSITSAPFQREEYDDTEEEFDVSTFDEDYDEDGIPVQHFMMTIKCNQIRMHSKNTAGLQACPILAHLQGHKLCAPF